VGAGVKVLFLAHRIPYPPDKGDKIRAFHFLEHLAASHQVWLGAAADDPADMRYVPVLKERCADVCVAPLGPVARTLNMLSGFHLGLPLSVARFRHRRLEAWIAHVLEDVRPDVVFIYSSALAQYLIGRVKPGVRSWSISSTPTPRNGAPMPRRPSRRCAGSMPASSRRW